MSNIKIRAKTKTGTTATYQPKRLQIGVIGSAGFEEYLFDKPDSTMYEAAEEIGMRLAMAGCIVINGGKGGVMEAVCRGAKRVEGSFTVAETAGIERYTANRYVDVEVVTGSLNMTGPSVLVGMCDAVIALGGGAGTLQELCVAYRLRKPTVLVTGYGGWTDRVAKYEYMDERRAVKFQLVATAQEAVQGVLKPSVSRVEESAVADNTAVDSKVPVAVSRGRQGSAFEM